MLKTAILFCTIAILFLSNGFANPMVSGIGSEGQLHNGELYSYDDNTVLTAPETPALHGLYIASEWAVESIARAHSYGLIPHGLFATPLFSDYILQITRAEFTALAVALYETITDEEITGRIYFNDTNDINVQKMGYLAVVTGVGNGYFNPNDTITREQAAVLLSRLSYAIQNHFNVIFPTPGLIPLTESFVDYDQIATWAAFAVAWNNGWGIMSGVGDNHFAPQGPYTREQSIITILRLYDLLIDWIPNNDQPSWEDAISMVITDINFNQNQLTVTIYNDSDYEIMKRGNFSVSRFDGTYWHFVPPRDASIAFTDVRLIINAGDSKDFIKDLTLINPLGSGLHRISNTLFKIIDDIPQGQHGVRAEFHWKRTGSPNDMIFLHDELRRANDFLVDFMFNNRDNPAVYNVDGISWGGVIDNNRVTVWLADYSQESIDNFLSALPESDAIPYRYIIVFERSPGRPVGS